MKKLLIFGDSFADEKIGHFDQNHPMYHEYNKLISFHKILRDSGLFDQITVHALGGSDLWSQYRLFKTAYTGTESVLWFETHPGRIASNDGIAVTNLSTAEHCLHDVLYGAGRKFVNADHMTRVLSAAVEYFKYLKRDDYDNFVHQAIIDDIKKNVSDIFFIPCFHNSVSCTGQSLIDITISENSVFNFSEVKNTHWDIRRNHMTEGNHVVLGNKIVDYYSTGAPVLINTIVKPSVRDFDKYFKKITTI